ncbi:MAG: phosphate ABC transporter substrate-binding protein [Flavobacterium sp.]|nr:MAG: phosphate ABC transporter substrate-binding protein [Flavobacterium sp.]
MIKTKFALLALSAILLVLSCNESGKNKSGQTILEGKAEIYTDESLLPIVEDQVAVFESSYNADISIVPKSETEVVNALMSGITKLAVLSRDLSQTEISHFTDNKIIPRRTRFATDAVIFIKNRGNNDTLIALRDVIDFWKGKSVAGIKGLVFDNLNSGTVRYLDSLAGGTGIPSKGIFSFRNNGEAIKYIAANRDMIGVVGLNWINQPSANTDLSNINVLSVKAVDGQNYIYPSQNNLAERKYPLARDLFVVDCQGFSGLGMGFASFIAGERGQRIILKSGLLPVRIPGRKIVIRNQINK